MRAPVYRNLDTPSTLLGLAFPTEVLIVLLAFWGSILMLTPLLSMAVTAGVYVGLRVVAYGRPARFLQHWLLFGLRQRFSGSRLSAAARAPAPRFPFARYDCRDAPSRRVD